ncbi:MAG: MarP family serine protease, partial [Candidatus Dormiibacterota bacterium]
FLGHSVGSLIGLRLRRTAMRSRLGGAPDSAAGVAWGLLVALAVSWYLGLVFAAGPVPALAAEIQNSSILRALNRALPAGPAWMGDLQHLLSAVPFPEVFATLVPPLPGPVTLPAELSSHPAITQVARETVKVVSTGCGGLIEGSGFPVGPDVVATNAHVVAGSQGEQVEVPGRSTPLRAQVIYFNPEVDLALLRVPNLGMTPLSFSEDSPRGTQGAVIGYPGGGNEQAVSAAVRGTLEAVGRDIYSQQLVSRQILVLQAAVIPGNSGGPFVNLSGQVLGVVFAKSLVTADEGYALTTAEVLPDIRANLADTATVSTQACVAP